MGLTFEKVWAMFQETERSIKEMSRETDRSIKEMSRETDRRIEEMSRERERQREETDRQLKEMSQERERRREEMDRQLREMSRETDRKISKLGNRIGELVEHLVAPNLLEKFKNRGFFFRKISVDVEIRDVHNLPLAEVDVLLENGGVALAVEVKSKLTIDDVKEHLDRMEKLRSYANEHQDSRKFLGAVAGAVIPEGVKPFAIKSGFFVIEQAGDTARIAVPEDFIPREW
jgi:hypothetical protein